jgi:hypothetical protein
VRRYDLSWSLNFKKEAKESSACARPPQSTCMRMYVRQFSHYVVISHYLDEVLQKVMSIPKVHSLNSIHHMCGTRNLHIARPAAAAGAGTRSRAPKLQTFQMFHATAYSMTRPRPCLRTLPCPRIPQPRMQTERQTRQRKLGKQLST